MDKLRFGCPEGEEKEKRGEEGMSSRLLKLRTILLAGEIDKESAQRVMSQLLLLSHEDPSKPIRLFIDSPGGDADAGYAMFDMIRFVETPVYTICTGLAASAAVIVLLASPRERRLSLPNARLLIHQPSTGIHGSASDIQIEASEILKIREKINKLIAEETEQTLEKVTKDMHRNFWMSAKEAQEYGLVGRVIVSTKEL